MFTRGKIHCPRWLASSELHLQYRVQNQLVLKVIQQMLHPIFESPEMLVVCSLNHILFLQSAMTPGIPLFSPMMPYGTGLTPQPVQSTNSLSILEEQQRQQQQQAAAQQSTSQPTQGSSGQTPQLFHSQTLTTAPLPGTTPLYPSPMTPMTPITPATPASESSGIVPQLQ